MDFDKEDAFSGECGAKKKMKQFYMGVKCR